MIFYTRRFVLLIVSIAMLAATPGCAISKKECLQGDWQTKGYEDGRDGKSPDIINAYATRCAKHGVTPDPIAYSAGFDVGITLYCTAENGLVEGEANRKYSGACPVELEKTFLKNYIEGLRLALSDLEIEYDRESLELDMMRANRDRLALAGESHSKDDKRIKYKSDSLIANTKARTSINQKIRDWSSKL